MRETLLTASALSKTYHQTKALEDVGLNLPKGKIIGLLVPNGSEGLGLWRYWMSTQLLTILAGYFGMHWLTSKKLNLA